MLARIIDRGRGPEIEGTRVTVYRIMDFLREISSSERIASELDLTAEQVKVALEYIRDHQPDVENAYESILKRVRQPNPTWVEAGRPRDADELRRRILARHANGTPNAATPRQ